jgi:hypothetical protein
VAAFEAETNPSWRSFGLPLAYHALGRPADVQQALRAMERHSGEFQFAEALAYIGDTDGALKWLEAARVNHDPGIMWLRGDPLLAGITADPRYREFVRRINLPD